MEVARGLSRLISAMGLMASILTVKPCVTSRWLRTPTPVLRPMLGSLTSPTAPLTTSMLLFRRNLSPSRKHGQRSTRSASKPATRRPTACRDHLLGLRSTPTKIYRDIRGGGKLSSISALLGRGAECERCIDVSRSRSDALIHHIPRGKMYPRTSRLRLRPIAHRSGEHGTSSESMQHQVFKAVIARLLHTHRHLHSIEWMCRMLNEHECVVLPATFYHRF